MVKRCEYCNSELSYCGPESIDGPTLDCKECQLREKIEKLECEIIFLKTRIKEYRKYIYIGSKNNDSY